MLVVSCGFAAWYGYRHGKQYALGAGMAASLLAGTWFEITIADTEINVTMATAIILLVAYCAHSWREMFRCLNLLDFLVAALMVWHITVDTYHDGQPLTFAAQAYGQWMLPYAAGRYAFLHPGSLTKLSPIFVAVAVFISLAAVLEAFTSINLWEIAFTTVDDKVARTSSLRYGMFYRAIGPVRHPIFLGVVLLSTIPFAIDLCLRSTATRKFQILGCLLLAVICLGIASTISRGPILCTFIAFGFAWACANRAARIAIATLVILGIAAVSLNTEAAIRLFDSEGTGKETARIIQVDGDGSPAVTTSSRHRIFVVQIYGPLVIKGGPLGFGTSNSTGFPPRNLPGLPAAPEIRKQLGIVDNSYINVGLRFGWIGIALFTASLLVAIALSLRLGPVASTYFYPSQNHVCFAYAGMLFAVMLEIITVFWSYDFSFWTLFQMGAAAGLTAQAKLVRTGQVTG
ncbi:hypothetical protein [Aporhodopirellula aestuarii]|uniref:O-antigen polymerase n=1 Tax=Aporhodopirellula aestuarii TaxID=2950107 RepID=A0ABT0TX93_9BACT|nr:hypothetical protein [Aporhodopirellula aestuarii]MCM2369222.1 hypothetical protein [Aporhodopirellula aestuarii]